MRRTSLLLCSLLIALRSLCALGVELSTVYIQFGEYVTKDNKKLDGKGARALCILKRLVNSVSSRVMFLEGQTNAYLGKARSVFAEITGSDVLRDALGEEKLRKHGGVVKLMNMSQVNAANAAEESKLVASNASKLLSDVLQWHCVGRGNKHNSSSGYVLNGNCDPDAYRREFYYNGDVNDLEKHSIPCNYKAISSEETEPTYERMERALNFWDVTKPKPDPDFTPCTDEHFSDTKQREQVSCTVLENWLQGYNDAKKKVKKLENLVLMGVKMSKYAEELLGDAKKAAERAAGPPEPNITGAEGAKQQPTEEGDQTPRLSLEDIRAMRQEAERRERALLKALEEAEAGRLAAEREIQELQRNANKRGAAAGLEEAQRVKGKVREAEERETALKEELDVAGKRLLEADEKVEIAEWEKAKAPTEEELERVAAETGVMTDGDEKDMGGPVNLTDGRDEVQRNESYGTLLFLIIVSLALLLLALLLYFFKRSERVVQKKDNPNP